MVLKKITSAPAPSRQAPAPTGPSRIVITPTGIQQVSIAPPPPPPTRIIAPPRIVAPPPSPPRTAQIRSPEEIARTNAELNDLHAIHVVESPSSSFIGPQQPSSQIQQSYITPATIYREPTPRKLISFGLPPAVPGLIGGVIPLTAASVSTLSNAPKPSEEENIYSVKGYKTPTSKGGAEAFDLSEKVLSETYTPMEYSTEIVKGGEPIVEVGPKYIDPSTGLLTQDTKTTTPGDIVTTTGKGGISQTLGQSEIKPDYSDPLGSFGKGVYQSGSNEVIGIANIPKIATGQKQEEYYASPSGILFGGLFEAGASFAGDVGGAVFDFGRQVAGKAPVQVGQSVTTFGIGGDEVTIQQQPRRGDAYDILKESGERATRIAVADPFYALGDAAVQIPLLVVSPLKAGSLALKGIGVASKTIKGVTQAGKASKLFSATGEAVSEIKPKTALAKTFEEEYAKGEAKAIQADDIYNYGELTSERKAAIQSSQRGSFEQGVERLQEGKYAIGETTAEFAGESQPGKLIKVPKAEVEKQAAEFYEKQGKSDLIPEDLLRELSSGAEGPYGRAPGTFGSPLPSRASQAVDAEFQSALKLQTKLEKGETLTKRELSELDRLDAAKAAKIAKAAEQGPEGIIGGIVKKEIKEIPEVIPYGQEIPFEREGIFTRPYTADSVLKRATEESDSVRAKAFQSLGKQPTGTSLIERFGSKEGGTFDETLFSLGKGTGRFGDDLGGIAGDVGKGGKGEGGAGGISSSDNAVIGKLSDSDIEKFSKETGLPVEDVEKLYKKSNNEYGNKATIQLFQEPERVALEVEKSQKLFELEKARTALRKTKASKAISSIEDQATQRRLSELIKEEKLKKPSTTADKLTQNALRKLINEEKTAIAERSVAKIAGEDTIDILRSKPRGLASGAESIFDESLYRKPGSKLEPGIFGVATGVAAGTALGLGLDFGVKPQVKTQPQIYDQVLTQKPSQVSVTKQIFESGLVQKQSDKQMFDFNYFQQPQTRQTTKQITKQQTDIFQIPTTRQTTKQITKQQTDIFEKQLYQPVEEVTTNQLFPPGIGGLPFGGNRMDIVGEQKNPRKFYRLFDIAKTPFGRVEIGVGAQIQSDRPIFEISEERPNITRPKRKRNVSETFFDTSEPQDLFF